MSICDFCLVDKNKIVQVFDLGNHLHEATNKVKSRLSSVAPSITLTKFGPDRKNRIRCASLSKQQLKFTSQNDLV